MAKSSTYCREGCDIYSSWLRHEDTIAELQEQLAGAEQELICLHIAIDRAVEKNKVLCGKQLELQETNERLRKLQETVLLTCNPPDDCNDVEVLKTYMLACFTIAMKEQENE